MLVEDAQRIVSVWGKHLEYSHECFQALFIASIPASLLPIRADTIEAALNIMAKHYHERGDENASIAIKETLGPLMLYQEDNLALRGAAIKFGETKIRDAICSRLKSIQMAANGAAYQP